MVSIEKYPFIFMNTPASLEVLALAEMALTIWRREFANTSFLDAKKGLDSKKKPRCEEVLNVPVARSIQAQIDKKVVSIADELKEWMDFHLNRYLSINSTEAFANCFKHIVVDFSGSIGYKATAINFLNSAEFTDAVNYKIACTFCLEDQIKRFWPAVANDSPIDANSRSDKSNLSYWNRLMKVENSIIDTEFVTLRVMEAEAKTKTVPLQRGDGIAFEYFCKMLPDDARISTIMSWLQRQLSYYRPAVSLKRTLSTLDRVQAEKVFEQKASSIFRILMRNDNYFHFAHQLWTLMGHLVLKDESNFSDVVSELWKMAFDPHCDNLNYTRCDQINDLLLEIWSNASDELKAHVSDILLCPLSPVFSTYCPSYWHWYLDYPFLRNNFASYYGHDMTFMLEMLSKWRDLNKVQWWQKNWRGLALRAKPFYLEQFMRMCLPNDDAVELFKTKIGNFKDLFESLIKEGFYTDLKDYLLFCSRDAEQFQLLGKKVLESNLLLISFHEDIKFAQFEWFVSQVFVNMKLEEFKRQMVSSAQFLKNLLAARKADKICSKDFSRRIITRFVNNEDELQLVKRRFLEHCREHPTETCFNADEWQEFLEWCTGDREEVAAFKRSLNVNMIFLESARSFLNKRRSFGSLDFLGNFLNWYFGNEEDAKNFKLQIVKGYKQNILISRVKMENTVIYFKYKSGLMNKLLLWLFDNNKENLVEFYESIDCSLRSL